MKHLSLRGGDSKGTLPEASKDLQQPSVETMLSFLNCKEVVGLRHKLVPATMAASQRPRRILAKA